MGKRTPLGRFAPLHPQNTISGLSVVPSTPIKSVIRTKKQSADANAQKVDRAGSSHDPEQKCGGGTTHTIDKAKAGIIPTFPCEVRSVVTSSAAMSIPVFMAAFLPLRGRSTHSEALCPMAPQFLQAPCSVRGGGVRSDKRLGFCCDAI